MLACSSGFRGLNPFSQKQRWHMVKHWESHFGIGCLHIIEHKQIFLLKCHISQMCLRYFPIFNVKMEDKVQRYHIRRKMCLPAIAFASLKCAHPCGFQCETFTHMPLQNKVSFYFPTLNSLWDSMQSVAFISLLEKIMLCF